MGESRIGLKLWRNSGPVQFGQYPNQFLGFGVETDEDKSEKICLATSMAHAIEICEDHNLPILRGERK